MSGPSRRRIVSGLALLCALGVAVTVHRHGGLSLDPADLRVQIAALGWLAPFGFIVVAAMRPLLLLPSWIIMSAGGLLFGIAGGIVIGTVGFTLGAAMMFWISRGLGRDVVQRHVGGRMERIDKYLRQRGPRWMAVWTGLPVTPLTPVHAAAGLSAMSGTGFVIAVVVGFLPRTALYSYFGDSLAQGDWRKIGIFAVLLVLGVAIGTVLARRGAPAAEGGTSG